MFECHITVQCTQNDKHTCEYDVHIEIIIFLALQNDSNGANLYKILYLYETKDFCTFLCACEQDT